MRALVLAVIGMVMTSACSKPDAVAPPPATAEPPGQPAPVVSPAALTGTIADLGGPEWKLERFSEADAVPADIVITLAVGGEQLSGRGGCNRYMGSIKNGDAPGKIAVGPLAMTRMACEPALDAAEQRYTKALQQATSFVIQDGRLTITYPDGESTQTLIYSRTS